MPRPNRPDPIDGIHHVMNRGVDRCTVFVDDESRVDFGRQLADIHDRFGVVTLAYCLMDNHYHLLLRCPEGGLSTAMQRLSAVFTRHVNDRLGRDGPIFRGRFTSRLVTTHRYVANAVRYIHRNALDRADVADVAEYRWSSHRAYLGHRRAVEWLQPDEVLRWFSGSDAFHRFVSGDPSISTSSHKADPGAVATNADFLLRALSADGGRVRAGDLRAAMCSLADRAQPSSAAMFEQFEFPSAPASRNARSRARRRLDAAPELRRLALDALDLAA